MSETQNVYRVWTIDPNDSNNNKFMLVLSNTLPTTGPNGEKIDPSLTVLVQKATSPNEVIVNEPSDGLFQHKTFPIDIPASDPGDEFNVDITWPADIMMWQSALNPTEDMIGDSFCVIYDPDLVVGEASHDVVQGDNVIHVNLNTLNGLSRGLDISISNGVKKEDLGAITSIDKTNNTITTELMAQSNFYTTSGKVYILYNYCMIKDRFVENKMPISFGSKGFKGKEISSGTKLRVKYKNMNGKAKKFFWHTEYYIEQ
jgi:hypothetical protein